MFFWATCCQMSYVYLATACVATEEAPYTQVACGCGIKSTQDFVDIDIANIVIAVYVQ